MSCCETQNLAVGYGAPLLRDIALHAERGKILALIGPNGAGKSTLLKTLAGQLAAQGGAVLLDGQDLTAYTPNARARKLALMLPHTARTELTSCFEVAAAGRYPYTGRLGILSDADRQQVHDALCLVRAEELEDRDFARISDGQRQRVLLARAVCQQPEILLLDEPTSFLDVKGKAELMDILQVLAHEKNVAVIVTLHELELAQRLADAVVCVAPSGVSAVLAPQDAFAQDNICALFGLSTDQYAVLFAGSGAKPKPQFEHYIRSGQRLLRCGYTTGTCAALGAAGAARLLLTGHAPESVGLRTPKGIVVEVAPQFCRLTADGAACAIVKDGGDDIDATTGLPVIAAVTLLPDAPRTVTIDGGTGVGRVTKPGLDQPVGAAAINRVPRQMITEALLREADAVGYGGGFAVVISIEGGEAAAKRTFNPHLGVEGGLSVLGTSGIVEPMSEQALLDTIHVELRQRRENGADYILLAPGNYGADYIRDFIGLDPKTAVLMSNFIGDSLEFGKEFGFHGALLIGHIGKFVKLAGGMWNTHSKFGDCRMEIIASHSAALGLRAERTEEILHCATCDDALRILDEEGLKDAFLVRLGQRIGTMLGYKSGELQSGAILFSKEYGFLCETEGAEELLEQIREG